MIKFRDPRWTRTPGSLNFHAILTDFQNVCKQEQKRQDLAAQIEVGRISSKFYSFQGNGFYLINTLSGADTAALGNTLVRAHIQTRLGAC